MTKKLLVDSIIKCRNGLGRCGVSKSCLMQETKEELTRLEKSLVIQLMLAVQEPSRDRLKDVEWCSVGFGHHVPTNAAQYWTARAIWQPYSQYSIGFDFVPDRRSQSGDLTEDFAAWLTGTAINTLHVIFQLKFDPSSDEIAYCENDNFIIVGNPQGSCGYAYLAAWEKVK